MPGHSRGISLAGRVAGPGMVVARSRRNTKEVTMHRVWVLAVVLAVLLTGALGVGGALAQMPKGDSPQPRAVEKQKAMEMNADKGGEGTIKSGEGSNGTLD